MQFRHWLMEQRPVNSDARICLMMRGNDPIALRHDVARLRLEGRIDSEQAAIRYEAIDACEAAYNRRAPVVDHDARDWENLGDGAFRRVDHIEGV